MVKCKCGMVFIPSFFNGICPKCKKKYKVTQKEIEERDNIIEATRIINQAIKGKTKKEIEEMLDKEENV